MTKKRFVTTLILAAIAVTCSVAASACAVSSGNSGGNQGEKPEEKPEVTQTLEYGEILDGGNVVVGYEVTGYKEGSTRLEQITVPAEYNSKPVTKIGAAAFYLEDGDAVLKKVVLPDTITDIDYNAFTNCTALATVNFPQGLKNIGQSSFWNTALSEAELPNTVEKIDPYAFYAIPSLKKITLNSQATVGKKAFCENTALTEVIFGSQANIVFEDDEYFFDGDSALNKITINSNNVKFGTTTLSGLEEGVIDLIYGDGVTAIPEKAMGWNSSTGAVIKSVTFGKNIKTVGAYAFYSCQKITEIVLPEGVTSIGKNAFANCISLEEITIPKSVEVLGEFLISSWTLKKVHYTGTLNDWVKINFDAGLTATPLYSEVPLYINGEPCETLDLRGAVKIGKNAFYNADYKKIILGEELEELGAYCFSHDSGEEASFFGDVCATANQLDALVILCKNLTVGSQQFANTFNANTEIFYYGTAAEMTANVTIDSTVNKFRFTHKKKILKHYFYSEEQPATAGDFWHFDAQGNVVKW